MYNTTNTKSLLKNPQQRSHSTDPLSFIGNKSVSLPTEEENPDFASFIGTTPVKLPTKEKSTQVVVCGRWYTFFDPATGGPRVNQRKCGKADCERCVEAKAYDLIERLPIDPLYVTTIHDDNWQAVHKHLKREGTLYQRIRQENDESIILLECDDSYFDNLERKSEITVEQAKMWFRNKPDGSRITGKLCASKSSTSNSKEKGETVRVSFDMICTNATYEQQRVALRIAISNTSDLLPDEHSLQKALNKRIREYKKALIEMECKIISKINVSRNVQITRIDWSQVNSNPHYLDTFKCVGGEKEAPVPF